MTSNESVDSATSEEIQDIELNHKFVLTRGIAITPDIQYVIRPAGVGQLDNALLLGGRLSIQF